MAFNVQEIRSQMTLGGARPSHFQVMIQNPVNGAGDLKAPFMIKSASLPPSELGTIELPYFGRKIKIPGDRTFAEWTVTVMNDEDFLVRNAMEQWMHSMNTHESNVTDLTSGSPLLYKSQAQIIQFSKTNVPIREYTFHGLWPSNLGEIETNWETTDAIEEFTVTFQYDWWSVTGGITGNSTP